MATILSSLRQNAAWLRAFDYRGYNPVGFAYCSMTPSITSADEGARVLQELRGRGYCARIVPDEWMGLDYYQIEVDLNNGTQYA